MPAATSEKPEDCTTYLLDLAKLAQLQSDEVKVQSLKMIGSSLSV